MNLIHLYGVVSEPVIPATAAAMRGAFALPGDTALPPGTTAPGGAEASARAWVSAEEARALDAVPAGTAFTVPPVLFAKIAVEDLAAYRDRFGGAEAAA